MSGGLEPPVPEDDVLVRSPDAFGEPEPRGVPRQASMPWLWFSVLGGISAYILHLAGIYWPLEQCTSVDRPVAAVATGVAIAVAAAATIAGVRARSALAAHHGAGQPSTGDPGEAWDPVPDGTVRRTLAVSGIVLSGLTLMILVLVAVAVVVVPPCM